MFTQIKQFISGYFKSLWSYRLSYLLGTILIQVTVLLGIKPILRRLFSIVLWLSGAPNFTYDNFDFFFTHPGAFILVTLYMGVVVAVIFLEYYAFVYLVLRPYRKSSLSTEVKSFISRCQKLFNKDFLWYVLFLCVLPLFHQSYHSLVLSNIKIPSFITGALKTTFQGAFFYYSLIILSVYIGIRLIYTMPLTVLNVRSFKENLILSWKLTKGKVLRHLITIGALIALVKVVATAFITLVILILSFINPSGNSLVISSLVYLSVQGMVALEGALISLLTIHYLVRQLIYFHEINSQPTKRSIKLWVKVASVIALIAMIFYSALGIHLATVNQDSQVISHRGDTQAGVENSLEALEAAAKQKVDYVEMDVIMTKDHQLVVSHDVNLKKLANHNINIYQMNLDQLQGLSIYQGKFKSQLVSFETYVKRAQELQQPLLIELKMTGHEPENYAQLVLNQLNRLGATQGNRIMSLDLQVMEELEKLDPNLETGYVIPLQFGVFEENQVDFYVVEDRSYSDLVALSAQKQNKDLYVWTINDEETMIYYLQTSVKGIITDRIKMYYEEKEAIAQVSNYFERALYLLNMR